ncbi:GTP-binding protein [Oxalobacter vibrioformis]|uniref:GTP-binding protein n=1 Tax=Oxalobacter vibrioformis TaxID=933080 RepID=A0A9E9LW60_9BURK|nr:Rab family GTPase [Oxalobacter vibrioformis]WAW10341.1 GTP-binding protein [Oxalobacter vibrioformis]
MLSKKVCMLGSFSVGKTSLVEQFLHSIFSDKYLSTVGVKISKKTVNIDGTDMSLVLWDMEGKDDYVDIKMSHLRGTMGFFVVADLTRLDTFDAALKIRRVALDVLGENTPHMLLLNKSDRPTWEVNDERIEAAQAAGIKVLRTSARTGTAVNEAFETLAKDMLAKT